jgi:hypothetical protein
MERNEDRQKPPREDVGLSREERAALVSEWRKNRADLSWKPLEGRELDRFLPFWNKVLGGLVAIVMIVGVILMLLLFSAPREVNEITATVIVAGKPDSEGYTTVVVALPDEPAKQMTYSGTEQLRQGQQVVLEETSSPFVAWKRYRFKDPPEGDS